MAWDKTLPDDTTKIRQTPSILQDNWEAIETGLVPYDYLQLSGQSTDPTRSDDTGWLYAKDPGAGLQELFYQDDDATANVVQITNNGGIGTTSQVVYASTITLPSSTTLTFQSIATAWGNVASTGTANDIFGATVVKSATGQYTITFSSALSNANYSVTATIIDTGARIATVQNLTTTTFKVNTIRVDNENKQNAAFSFVVFGGS